MQIRWQCPGADRASGWFLTSCDVNTDVNPFTNPSQPTGLEEYGQNVFRGALAGKYLRRYGRSAALLQDVTWTARKDDAEAVAAALRDWAVERGATSYCHWFQPMGSGGVRHGQAACVQISMLSFDKAGKPSWEFDAAGIARVREECKRHHQIDCIRLMSQSQGSSPTPNLAPPRRSATCRGEGEGWSGLEPEGKILHSGFRAPGAAV